MKVSQMLGCISKRLANGSGRVLCLSLLRLHLMYHVHFWAPKHKTDIDLLERVQWGATKMI